MADKLLKVAALVVMTLVAGCSTVEPARERVTQRLNEADELAARAGVPGKPVSHDALEVSDAPWVGGSAVRMRRGRPLPTAVEGARGIGIRTIGRLTEICEEISAKTGIPVRVADMELPGARPGGQSSVALAYEGPLSGGLDVIAGQVGGSWRYDGSAITVFRYETRTFMIHTLPGTQTVATASSGGSIGGIQGGGVSGLGNSLGASTGANSTTQTTKLDATIDAWTDMRNMLTALLAGQGTYNLSPSSGALTVVTTPERMIEVAQYIEGENRRLTKQLAVTIEVWTVDVSDLDDYGLDLNVLFDQGQGLALNFAGAPVPIVGAGVLSAAILDGPAVSRRLAKLEGSDIAFRALSQVGRVGRKGKVAVTVLNNRPAMRKIAVDQAYLCQSGAGVVSNGVVTQPTLVPCVASKGITTQLLPRILDDGRVLLEYSIQIGGEPRLRTETSADQRIELPTQAKNEFVGHAELRSGATLILGSYDQDSAEARGNGLGDAWNGLMGGVRGNLAREMIVILITPVEFRSQAFAG